MPYCHLTRAERTVIEQLDAQGFTQAQIARALKRSPSTISRELARNRNNRGGYDPHLAQYRYLGRRKQRIRSPKLKNRKIMRWVVKRLKRDWSPEQIAGRLRSLHAGNPERWISHESIYRFIRTRAKGLRRHLRHGRKRYRKPGSASWVDKKIPGRVGIEQRPEIVQEQGRFGDWEGDTVMGKQGALRVLTLVERRSLYLLTRAMPNATADALNRAALDAMAHVPKELRHTLTVDNGAEFTHFKELEQGLQTTVYFAHPYSAWERGTNENTNGLLRQYLPKGKCLSELTPEQLARYTHQLNNRPRKKLGYRTPEEVFSESIRALAT